MSVIYVTEEESSRLVTPELAFRAVKAAFIAAAGGGAVIFPVVAGHASDTANRFTIKSSTDDRITGLKIGSYFPSNDAMNLPRHNSMTLLFDQPNGKVGAVLEMGKANALRTAAADAVATDVLARKDATAFAVFGVGHQAEYEALALARVRPMSRLFVVGRDPARSERFAGRLRAADLPAEVSDAEQACLRADVIVTATNSESPLFSAEWVRPGTHISSMGSDQIGKQELPPELFRRSKLFCDMPDQSRRIGEFQHSASSDVITAIGTVLAGLRDGRTSPDDITIFDSSGISLQDLYVADELLRARERALRSGDA